MNVQFYEALGLYKLIDDCLADLVRVGISTVSHKEDCWLDTGAKLFECLIQDLLSVDSLQIGCWSKIFQKLLRVLIEESYLLGED